MDERRTVIDGTGCYSCQHTLARTLPVFNNDVWTIVCPACGIVNKLTPAPGREGQFLVKGAYFIVQLPGAQKNRPPASSK